MKWYHAVGLLIGVSLLVVSQPSVAAPREGEGGGATVEEKVYVQSFDEALAADAKAYADSQGVTEKEAARRLIAMDEYSETLSHWSSLAGDRFAGAYFEHDEPFRVVLRVTGTQSDLPDPLKKSVANSRIPVEVVGSSHTTRDLSWILENADWQRLVGDWDGVWTDVKAGSIHVATRAVTPAPDTSLGDLIARSSLDNEVAVGKALPLGASTVPIVLHPNSKPDTLTNRGGRVLSTCTSAFAVQNKYGEKGITTAGHCENPQSYYWFSGAGPFAMSFIAESKNGYADLQWHTTTAQAVEPLFHVSPTEARAQGARGVGQVWLPFFKSF